MAERRGFGERDYGKSPASLTAKTWFGNGLLRQFKDANPGALSVSGLALYFFTSGGRPLLSIRQSQSQLARISGYPSLVSVVTLLGIGLSITVPYMSLFGTNVVHMNPLELGLFMFLSGLGAIVASTWLASVSDASRPKKDIILFSSVCAAIGYGSFAIVHSYLLLVLISTVILGLGSSTFPQIFAYAKEATSNSGYPDPTFALSLLRSFFSLAWVIGPLIGAWTLQQLGFSGIFVFTAGLFMVVFLLVVVFLRRNLAAAWQTSMPSSVLATLKRPEVLLSSIAFVAAFSASSMNGMYMPLYTTRVLHAPEHVVGLVASLSAGLEIPVMLMLGGLARRLGKRPLLLLGSVSGTLYFVGVTFSRHVWEMLVVQLFCAVFIAIIMSIGMSYFQEFMPESPGAATTLYSNTNRVGSMAGSLLGGVIAQIWGFQVVYWVCAGLAAVSYLFLLRPGFVRRLEAQTLTANNPGP